MNACLQVKHDFSIFILQFSFFNGCATSEKHDFPANANFCSAYSLQHFHQASINSRLASSEGWLCRITSRRHGTVRVVT